MAQFIEKDQEVLFAVSVSGFCPILGAIGKLAISESREMGNLEDIGIRQGDLPDRPGLYVWSGSIWCETGGWCGSEPVDPDIEWRGAWSPACLCDLRRFGMTGGEFVFPPLPPVAECLSQ